MIRILSLAALASLAAAPGAVAQVAPPPAMVPEGTILDVVAEGASVQTPDLATIQAGVVTNAPTAADAMRQNAAKMADILAALRKAGVAERDLQTASINLNPQYRYKENEPPAVTGYQASNQVTVRFRDIAKSGAILDALVAQGANSISGPSLSVDKSDAALDAARRDAIARARARADLYASAAGMRVDRILMISEGDAPAAPRPGPIAMEMTRSVAPQTEVVPGEQRITATLSVRFLLK
ncbi:SIMPL domain-containing protein [Sphingomonas sp. RS6]